METLLLHQGDCGGFCTHACMQAPTVRAADTSTQLHVFKRTSIRLMALV
jgi:hypothetical protein